MWNSSFQKAIVRIPMLAPIGLSEKTNQGFQLSKKDLEPLPLTHDKKYGTNSSGTLSDTVGISNPKGNHHGVH
jgi:hypothetical protein